MTLFASSELLLIPASECVFKDFLILVREFRKLTQPILSCRLSRARLQINNFIKRYMNLQIHREAALS